MSATITAVKEFLKIPEGQRFVAGCIAVIIALVTAFGIAVGYAVGYNKDVIDLQKSIGIIHLNHGTEIRQMQRSCDSELNARLYLEISEIKEQYRGIAAENNRLVKDALNSSIRQVNSSRQANKNINQALHELKK